MEISKERIRLIEDIRQGAQKRFYYYRKRHERTGKEEYRELMEEAGKIEEGASQQYHLHKQQLVDLNPEHAEAKKTLMKRLGLELAE